MNTRFATTALAALGAIALLSMPSVSRAGNIGVHGSCFGGSKNSAITTAGHTPVAVATLDAASLASLSGLIIENCNGESLSSKVNSDVQSAVSNGMQLVINDWNPGAATQSALPGTPAMAWQYSGGSQLDLVAGMPFITGPGGTLTDASLDGGNSSHHGLTTSVAPEGVTRLLTTPDPSQTVGISYSFGSGQVVYNAIPMDAYLPGGALASNPVGPGMQTYLTNILANVSSFTSCADEGFTGIKLTLCRQICEVPQSSARLSALIRAYFTAYRENPPCAL
ncbi:MAG: hypothetical protein V4704_09035 [Pseudomonadota bacterium]